MVFDAAEVEEGVGVEEAGWFVGAGFMEESLDEATASALVAMEEF